jgi:hypothetical protein
MMYEKESAGDVAVGCELCAFSTGDGFIGEMELHTAV